MTPSTYQRAIYDFISNGRGNAVIEAVAGSGKTTTIVNAITSLPPGTSSIFLAFNKSIATELTARGVRASTFHALALNGLRPLLSTSFKIEGGKVNTLFRNLVHPDLQDDYTDLPRLVSLGKNYGIDLFPTLPNHRHSWEAILAQHDLTFPDEGKACEFAAQLLNRSNADRKTIDFDDMLYLNLKLGAPAIHYDYVFVDEAQDTNSVQRALLRKIDFLADRPVRFIFVGDRHQAIYGFRGAGTTSMDEIRDEFRATCLPLSVSYRCPKLIVEAAKAIVPQIEPAPDAPRGSITHHESWGAATFPPDSVILCRNTKPIIRVAYSLLREGRRVQVLGKDIGTGFKAIIKRCKAARTLDDLINCVNQRKTFDMAKELAAERHAKAAAIEDKYDSLLCILDQLDPATLPKDVPAAIDELFAAHPGAVQLATVHKSKGLEWDNVFILDRSALMPSKWAKLEWQLEQEYNLIYVAITRAKQHLHYIDSTDFSEEGGE